MARVICCVLLTLVIRRRMSLRVAMIAIADCGFRIADF
jgi:hypothetical protein